MEAKQVISASWASSTKASYDGYIKNWQTYCTERNMNPYEASFDSALEFLVVLHNKGAKYGSVAGARSALSSIIPTKNNITFGKDDTVSRALKGMFKIRPRLPRYVVVYDTDDVLDYMVSLPTLVPFSPSLD